MKRNQIGIFLLLFLIVSAQTASAFQPKKHKQAQVKTEAECRELGGAWWSPGMPGNIGPKICDLPTKDKGKTCSVSSECEGYCLSSMKFAIPFITKGKCSGSVYLVGCNNILEAGSVEEVCFN